MLRGAFKCRKTSLSIVHTQRTYHYVEECSVQWHRMASPGFAFKTLHNEKKSFRKTAYTLYASAYQCVALPSYDWKGMAQTRHDDVIKWKYFLHYWPFLLGIHRSPVNSPHKGQWCGTLLFSLIRTWINSCVSNRESGDLWRHRDYHGVTVMPSSFLPVWRSREITVYVVPFETAIGMAAIDACQLLKCNAHFLY